MHLKLIKVVLWKLKDLPENDQPLDVYIVLDYVTGYDNKMLPPPEVGPNSPSVPFQVKMMTPLVAST
jgi:hypothetical protein